MKKKLKDFFICPPLIYYVQTDTVCEIFLGVGGSASKTSHWSSLPNGGIEPATPRHSSSIQNILLTHFVKFFQPQLARCSHHPWPRHHHRNVEPDVCCPQWNVSHHHSQYHHLPCDHLHQPHHLGDRYSGKIHDQKIISALFGNGLWYKSED